MAGSIREALEAAANDIGETAPVDAPAPSEPPQESETQSTERARDDSGKFAKSSTNSTAQATPPKGAASTPAPSAPAAVEPDAPWKKPPSSWGKEYWQHYTELKPEVQQYVHTREGQYATGVSTYKTEADRAKVLWDAIAPFQPDLQKHNVQPEQWIRDLGHVQRILLNGTLPEKIQILQNVAQRNGVPLQAFATGQIDPIQQYVAPLQQQIQSLTGQLNGWQQQREQQEQQQLQTEVQQFASDATNYPHFEAVRPKMIRLLETGYAEDLKSAYRIAVRDDDAVWEAEQQRLAAEKANQANQDRQQRVNTARQNAVSPRSDTPSGSMTGDGKKGLRSNIEAAAEAILGGGRL